jgi:hypothetical protein
MKNIYCFNCECKVGELKKGGIWRRGAKGICSDCIVKLKTKDFGGSILDMFEKSKGKSGYNAN